MVVLGMVSMTLLASPASAGPDAGTYSCPPDESGLSWGFRNEPLANGLLPASVSFSACAFGTGAFASLELP